MRDKYSTALLILRVSTGILFLLHGIAKIQNGTGFVESTFVKAGLPAAMAYLVYLGEVIAPLMMIIGFRTKIAAFLIMGTVAVIVLTTGMSKFGQLTQVGAWALEVQGLFFFNALALMLTGGGKYAVSHKNKWD